MFCGAWSFYILEVSLIYIYIYKISYKAIGGGPSSWSFITFKVPLSLPSSILQASNQLKVDTEVRHWTVQNPKGSKNQKRFVTHLTSKYNILWIYLTVKSDLNWCDIVLIYPTLWICIPYTAEIKYAWWWGVVPKPAEEPYNLSKCENFQILKCMWPQGF